MRRLINDTDARHKPLEIFEQEVPVFEEPQHAQIHAHARDQPNAAGVLIFRARDSGAQPKIHGGGGKEQSGKRRIPGAVENIACNNKQVFPRGPGAHAPIRGHHDNEEDNECERVEQHGTLVPYLVSAIGTSHFRNENESDHWPAVRENGIGRLAPEL